MKRTLLILLFILINGVSFGQYQPAIDSLKTILRNSKQDTLRALALRELCTEYRNFDLDSSLIFGQQALKLSEQIKFARGQARSYSALAGTYRNLGDFPRAWEYNNKCQKIANEYHLYLEQALSFNMLGLILVYVQYTNQKNGLYVSVFYTVKISTRNLKSTWESPTLQDHVVFKETL